MAALAVLCLTGCGAASLSTTELRNQATRVCSAARKQTNLIATPTSPAGGAAFLSQGLAVLGPELAVLRKLRPPRDLAQVYSTAVGAFSQKVAALRETANTLKGGGDPVIAMKTLQQQLAPLESDEDGAWRALEIPSCMNG
jgi:hypothetical protein